MDSARTSGELREHNRVRLLRAVHDCAASRTRSQLTRDLGLARGTASVLVAGLGEDELLGEAPAPAHTRGRPTQVPGPHPSGPLALAVDLREDSWDLAVCALGGPATVIETRPHDGTPDGALLPLADAVGRRLGPRVVGVGMSVAGPVRDGTLLDIAHLGWRDIEVAARMALGPVPLYVGNDARLAGLAEARRGALHGVRVGLHLHIAFDLGGALLIDGELLHGHSGTAGEFGHLPLTGGSAPCRCGATGCWGLDVGGNALLRHLGLAAGGGRGWDAAERILAEAARDLGGGTGAGGTDTGADATPATAAVTANAHALGTGIGALVNGLDPEAVTLSGLGVDLHRLAHDTLDAACADSLMAFRRDRPRPVRIAASALGRQGPLTGAMESVFDAFLTPDGLAAWRTGRGSGARPADSARPAPYAPEATAPAPPA